jgi:hypothetical protein
MPTELMTGPEREDTYYGVYGGKGNMGVMMSSGRVCEVGGGH